MVQCAELGWAGGLGSRHARHPLGARSGNGPNITLSVSIAFKIRKMGHMVNFVFDGEYNPFSFDSAQNPENGAHGEFCF
jgi:hypothetical protein